MTDRSEFIKFLERQVHLYKAQLEGMFGKCDEGFVFGTIKKSTMKSTGNSSVPHTEYPDTFHFGGNCLVDVHISEWPWDHCSYDQGAWQVAHECVHLLDPVVYGTANYLEEGLATWFQDEPRFHADAVQRYIRRNTPPSQNYALAKRLVSDCMPQLIPAVKEIRLSNVRISRINADTLKRHLPNVDPNVIERLCDKFPY